YFARIYKLTRTIAALVAISAPIIPRVAVARAFATRGFRPDAQFRLGEQFVWIRVLTRRIAAPVAALAKLIPRATVARAFATRVSLNSRTFLLASSPVAWWAGSVQRGGRSALAVVSTTLGRNASVARTPWVCLPTGVARQIPVVPLAGMGLASV